MDNYIRDYQNNNYQDYEEISAKPSASSLSSAFSILMRKVYLWMTLALVVSGLSAYYVAGSEQLMAAIYGGKIAIWVLFIAELALVIGLTAAIQKLSFPVAATLFALYSIINGVTLASIFYVYSTSAITTSFFVAAGTFAAMAVVGSFTQKDLTKFGPILLMALVGLIIAGIVNIFLKNSMMDFIISIVGVLIFVGLTAYDAQKIKNMMVSYGTEVNNETQKLAIIGALTLYLDFINLFLHLLRIFGRRE